MKLLFVYNANSGYVNSAFDALHKMVSPKTYNCSLCNLTHGAFNEKKEWSMFVKQSKHTFEFFHKDEFEERFKQKFSYPCVLSKNESSFDIIIDNQTMKSFSNLEELINEIKNIKA